jgi:signal transduction histidine kinase
VRRLTEIDRRAIDAVAAVVLFAAATAELLLERTVQGSVALNVAALAFATLPLAFRRRAPLESLGVIVVAGALLNGLLTEFDEEDTFIPYVAYLLTAYGCGAFAEGAKAVAGLVVGCLGVGVISLLTTATFGDFFFPMVFMALAWLAGRTVRHRNRLAAELHEAAVQAAEAHEAEAARAVASERRRIAREMHDVVAHSMSVMVVQAGGARRILRQDPARADAAGEQIERTGREALAEMRRMLGFLRAGEDDDPTEPQPGLDRLDALVARTRDAGLPVTVRVVGEPRRLSSGLDLTAYRIVQEGLTNALKHAGGAPTAVDVRWGAQRLELEIRDGGRGRRPTRSPNGDGGGHGLVGMQERVRLYGGELRAGRSENGGFAVLARLPLNDEEGT